MDIRLGVAIRQTVPTGELAVIAKYCEDLGHDQVWYSNHKLSRDLYAGMTLIAANTRNIGVGSFIAEPYSVHPAVIAAAIATVDELSRGRAILLLGAGAANFKQLAITRHKPVTAIKETIEICRALLSGKKTIFRGEIFSLLDGQLDFETRPDLPIYVAARGYRMLEMSGATADGVMVATHATPSGLKSALSIVDKGCQSVGRTWKEIPILTRVDVSINADPDLARRGVRRAVSSFLTASYPDRSFLRGLGMVVPERLERICRQQDDKFALEAGHLVPEEFLDAFTWAGTPSEVAVKVASVLDMGIRHITYVPYPSEGHTIASTMQSFAKEVMPRARALMRG